MDKGKYRFYVVSKGRQPGIYESWPDCERRVLGFQGCKFRGFNTYGEALAAFHESDQNTVNRVRVNVRGQGSGCEGSNAGSQNAVSQYLSIQRSATSSGNHGTTVNSSHKGFDFVAHANMHEFVIIKSMEKWLLPTCYHLQIACPIYYRHERYTTDASPYYGFTVILPTNHLGIELKATGKYAVDQHHAREDAAFNLLSQLLEATGMNIFYYNRQYVIELHQHVRTLESELAKADRRLVR